MDFESSDALEKGSNLQYFGQSGLGLRFEHAVVDQHMDTMKRKYRCSCAADRNQQ